MCALGKLLILVQGCIQACGLDARYDKKGNAHVMQNCGVFESLCLDLFPLIWQGTQACKLSCHVLNTLLLLSTIRNRNKYYKSIPAKETASFLFYCCTTYVAVSSTQGRKYMHNIMIMTCLLLQKLHIPAILRFPHFLATVLK